ncbi:uncharacterized protein LOC118645167 [Monomorium pharaonis]|uniref:uncharacterized protein LOC118645167 n=1 Tax=Monomorium pharaonis TaxID=307658 RepID=UPI00174736CE|nr:uncharacterized protein LOC118645167 [Monomorium pharaonis]
MSLIEVDFANEPWPIIKDIVSTKMYERFCNDTTLSKDYHEMLLKQRDISYSPILDKGTLIEMDITGGKYKYKELITANMFLRMHNDTTLKEDWKEMLSLKMNIKCKNDEMDEFIYIDKNKNNTCTETQFPECSESSLSTSFIYTPSALDDVQWLPKKTWFFIKERFKREKKFQDPKSHVDKYWNEILQLMISNGYTECKEKGIHGLKTKFKNLMVTYRRNADKRRKKTGESSIK